MMYVVQMQAPYKLHRSSPRNRKSPKQYIPNISAAKKWEDNGTTGFKVTEKDLDKQCEEWKVKTAKAKARVNRAKAKIVKLVKERDDACKVIARADRLQPVLVERHNAADNACRDAVQAEAIFLFNMVNENGARNNHGAAADDDDDENSVDSGGDDETVSMSSSEEEEKLNVPQWATGVTGSPDY
jgi:hypothetical protein